MQKILTAVAALVATFASVPASAQQSCGSAYVPNRYGGTVITGLPSCDGQYSWQYGPQGRYWGSNQGPQFGGGGYVIRQQRTTVHISCPYGGYLGRNEVGELRCFTD
jgi:hypothetical protein